MFDNFVQYSFRVIVFVSNKDICHPVSDEFEGLHIVLVFVESRDIVFQVYFRSTRLLLHLIEQEIDVSVGPFFDLVGDVDVRDERPRDEEIG